MSIKPSIETAKAYIYGMDLSMIIKKMVNHQGWLQKDAMAISKLYRDYLFLQKKYEDETTIVPPEEVDEFWHNHILDTQKYHTDCQAIFGKYLHHYPYFGIDATSNATDLNDAFEITLSLYVKEFGHPAFAYNVRNFFSKLLGKIQNLTSKQILKTN